MRIARYLRDCFSRGLISGLRVQDDALGFIGRGIARALTSLLGRCYLPLHRSIVNGQSVSA